MNVKLIGRKKELEALREYVSSNRSEFVRSMVVVV